MLAAFIARVRESTGGRWAGRLRESRGGRLAAALLGSRTFGVLSGVVTVGCVGKEVVGYFAQQHEAEPGMAELCLGIGTSVTRARREKEAQFRALVEAARRKQAAGESASEDALAAHRLLYPTLTPEELRARKELHGAVKWTDASLAMVARYSPLVEIGAGRGQWQKALTMAGADVLAFDDMSSPSTSLGMHGVVERGNETVAAKFPERSLLLVYPNPGRMAYRCLQHYQGSTLVFVGEGRGGVNGDDAFFDLLGREWQLQESCAVDPLPDCFERVWVLRRLGAG